MTDCSVNIVNKARLDAQELSIVPVSGAFYVHDYRCRVLSIDRVLRQNFDEELTFRFRTQREVLVRIHEIDEDATIRSVVFAACVRLPVRPDPSGECSN